MYKRQRRRSDKHYSFGLRDLGIFDEGEAKRIGIERDGAVQVIDKQSDSIRLHIYFYVKPSLVIGSALERISTWVATGAIGHCLLTCGSVPNGRAVFYNRYRGHRGLVS